MENNELKFKNIQCNLCGCKEHSKEWKIKSLFFPQSFSYVQCQKCGLIYQNPQLTLKSFKDLEKEFNYDVLFQHSQDVDNLDKSKEKGFKKIICSIEKFKHGGSILDVGCGEGLFLAYLKKKSHHNWNCLGVEIQNDSAKFGRKNFKIPIITKNFLEFKSNKRFDVVYSNASLEHMQDPKNALDKMKNLLKSQGLLIIRVPNNQAFGLKIFQRHWMSFRAPEHFFLFSLKNFKDYFEKNNFKILGTDFMYTEINLVGSLRELIKENLMPVSRRIQYNRKKAVATSSTYKIAKGKKDILKSLIYKVVCLSIKFSNLIMAHFKLNMSDSFRVYAQKVPQTKEVN